MLRGIVLAGGQSSRMGSPKAGLRLGAGGPTFAAAAVAALRGAGIEHVVVVAGAHPEAVRGAVADVAVDVVVNPHWTSGQLSSLLTGLDAVEHPGLEAVVVTLVDVPLVLASTVADVIAAWRRSRAPVVRPVVGARHGHPVVFDRAAFAALRAAPLEVGAKAVLARFAARIVNVPTDDAGVLRDVDTPDDYAALLASRSGPDAT